MIKIVKPTEPLLVNNLIVAIYGQPGSGKTSLGFSAKNSLLLDFDGGVHLKGRGDLVSVKNWSDIADLSAEDLAAYETIVIDTVGRLLEVLAIELGKKDIKIMKKDGALTIPGYGVLSATFRAWMNKIRSFNKHIVLLAHAKESTKGNITIIRPDIMGGSKDEICKIVDLLGYLSVKGDDSRILDFNPTEEFLGKNRGEVPAQNIPKLSVNKTFLGDLINDAINNMNSKSEEQIKYEQSFNHALELIDECIDAISINELLLLDIVTSNKVLRAKLHEKALALGLIANVKTKQYEEVDEIKFE